MAFTVVRNACSFPLEAVPLLDYDGFRAEVLAAVGAGGRLVALFGAQPDPPALTVYAVLAHGTPPRLTVGSFRPPDTGYPSLTPSCTQAHWFERELAEQWAVEPLGHPWLKPLRFERPWREGTFTRFSKPEVGVADFFALGGEEVHEVAVGPVHAGIIEPGHFRFQCHGELVFHLEISLGYQHRGVEKALVGGPNERSLPYAETLAGDTSVGHAVAYCQALEGLSSTAVPRRAQALRAVGLELERLANHVGDLGALANDVGYLPTASFCGRIRGDFLNMTALVCGNRFGRGLACPGGVAYDLEPPRVEDLLARLSDGRRDFKSAAGLLWETPSVRARFAGTGALSAELSRELGLVGPAARACGTPLDVRHDFPAGHYELARPSMSLGKSSDVFARAYVRWLEVKRSLVFLERTVTQLPDDGLQVELQPLPPRHGVVSLVEGWRGEICHVALTDAEGRFARYKVVDPSFHNWFGLAVALRSQQISDFPLCNKSFNLSYCGHDL